MDTSPEVTTAPIRCAPRILRLREVAERLGFSPSYAKKVVTDRASAAPKLPPHIHAQFPPMKRGGVYGGRWSIYEAQFETWLRGRLS